MITPIRTTRRTNWAPLGPRPSVVSIERYLTRRSLAQEQAERVPASEHPVVHQPAVHPPAPPAGKFGGKDLVAVFLIVAGLFGGILGFGDWLGGVGAPVLVVSAIFFIPYLAACLCGVRDARRGRTS